MTIEEKLITYETPLLVLVVVIEIFISFYFNKGWYTVKDTSTNIFLTVCNFSLDLLMRAANFIILGIAYKYQVFHIENVFIYWIALLVFEDFLYYLLHYIDHSCRLFWAVHVTHHSSDLMNFTTGFRSSVFQPLYRVFYFIPLALCGFEPLHIFFIYALTQFWGIFVHNDYIKSLGFLEHVLITPSHHRVHHASNPEYLDKNMGMFLVIWDKIFGTFQKELPDVKPIYGLTSKLEDKTPVNTIFHEWKAIFKDVNQNISLKHKFGYIFGLPGWSHDGSRMTSVEMRQKLNKDKTNG